MELDLASITEAIADRHPTRDCLVAGDRRLDWATVRERTRRLAAVLHGAGLGRAAPDPSRARWEPRQDHVALYLLNGPEYLEGMLGAWKGGCAGFNVNYRYVADELRYLLDDSGARAIVVHERFTPVLAEVLDSLRVRPEVILQVADGSGHGLLPGALDYEAALAAADPDLPASLVASWSGDDVLDDDRAARDPARQGVPVRRAVHERGSRQGSHPTGRGLDELVERVVLGAVTAPHTERGNQEVRLAPHGPLRHAGGTARVAEVHVVARPGRHERRRQVGIGRGQGRLVVERAGQQAVARAVGDLQDHLRSHP